MVFVDQAGLIGFVRPSLSYAQSVLGPDTVIAGQMAQSVACGAQTKLVRSKGPHDAVCDHVPQYTGVHYYNGDLVGW